MAMASESLILCLLLFLFPLFITAQTKSRINLGSSLSTLEENTSWASPSGEFAFGFRRIAGTNLYLLAIWFDKIPDKTIIWYPNPSNDPTMLQRGSEVKLTSDGQLILSDQNGQEIWSAEATSVSYAAMLDTGNFVLASNDSIYPWQSFDHPSDTLLPSQVLDPSNSLFSHQSDSNYSIGKFQLQLLNGDAVLNRIALPTKNSYGAYWTSSPNTQGSGLRLRFDPTGSVYIEMLNGSSVNLTLGETTSTQEFYRRVTLDPDGVFRKYIYPRNGATGSWQPSWSTSWWVPKDICSSPTMDIGSGICGFNSYCILGSDQRPTCQCPPGYSYVDPNNTRNGCKPDFILQSCNMDASEAGVTYVMRYLLGTNWPTSDYERLTPMNEDDCRKACLEDCLCAVAIFGSAGCWKKKLPLSNGRSFETDAIALIKVALSNSPLSSPPQESLERKRNQSKLIFFGAAMLGGSILIHLFLRSGIALSPFLPYRRKQKRLIQDSDIEGVNLRSFTYKELEKATDMFKEELGTGSFGAVYKGVLGVDATKLIAVKQLKKFVQEGEKEFKTEMKAIGRTHHRNLVQLLGYCDEGQHRLLVYEFMTNGSLARFLFGSKKPSWDQRMDIAFGTARGLVYLHEECSSQIIHCDIKPQNILLDDCYTAKIADFGLAKLLETDQARTSTCIRGTRGYVAPEWFKNRRITAKVDVYSFGIVLLEIICCRKNVDLETGSDEKAVLADWAYDCYMERRLERLVEDDAEAKNDPARLEKLVRIAIWCTQEDPSLRPSMKEVVQMLEGTTEVPPPPDLSYISSRN